MRFLLPGFYYRGVRLQTAIWMLIFSGAFSGASRAVETSTVSETADVGVVTDASVTVGQPEANTTDDPSPAVKDDGITKNVSAAAKPGFFKRFAKAYWDDWHPSGSPAVSTGSSEPAYRGFPPPVSNPPFPFNVWPIGGTPWIGYPNSTQYPLTTALQTGPNGDFWKKANVQIYGWLDVGMNVSTSSARPYGNLPVGYAEIPNTFQLDQFTMYIERVPDTIQTDHFDWGFRFTNLYGLDYRFTTARGYFSQQLLNNPQANGSIGLKNGYDPVMAYVDLYFPHVGKGMDVRIGRYISLPDIEAQLAPNNYTYTHSLTYTYDCYTQTGVNATIKWSNHWTTQFGLSGGCEAAPWAPNAKVTGNVCAGYTWSEGADNIYVCANSINDGKYNYNNLAAYYATWYHKFGHSKWHSAWETWYQYMRDTPNINNPNAASLLINNSNGAYCNHPTELTCFAPEWASVAYISREINKSNALIARTEYFDDLKGQRTGYQTKYSGYTLSWNHWIGTTVLFRPELTYDHAYDSAAFNNGTKKSQLMFAGDVIFFY
ncbi:MAG: outer membrane beta-barrel protein [Acidobacteriaceae bacterium]|nr:outer membrane beta-barrel protein [Acidobacteriaceae bacterium]